MAIYLKKFETQAAYEAAQSGLILPNVSLTVDNNTVHYNPSTPVPPTPTHDYVEIGGIKWATMNIGANSITDYGLKFQWGDTQGYTNDQVGSGEGQKDFGWNDYKYWTADTGSGSSGMTKYNATDGKTVLDAEDDAVTAAWGGNWRMPTTAEYVALGKAVNSVWTADYQGSGVAGVVLTDKTDSSKVLFFPAAGSCYHGSVSNVGGKGDYWSSSPSADCGGTCAFCMSFYKNFGVDWAVNGSREGGDSVRGVLDE